MEQTRRVRSTKKQIELLIHFFESNPELSSREVPESVKLVKWEKCKDLLNSLDGPKKTVREWRTVLTDLKTNRRRKGPPKRAANFSDLKDSNFIPKFDEKSLNVPKFEEQSLNVSKFDEQSLNAPKFDEQTTQDEDPYLDIIELDSPEESECFIEPFELIDSSHSSPSQPTAKKKRRRSSRSSDLQGLIESQTKMADAINNLARSIVILAKKIK